MKKNTFDKEEIIESLSKVGKSIERLINANEKQLVLEVGNQATKMIEYVVKKNEINVVNGFVTNTPNNSIKKDRLINVDALVNTINQSINATKITTKEFVVSITSREIITREMPVHKMSDKDLENFVKFNASDIFPINLEDYILGYNINEKGATNKVMIAAIPKDIVIPYIELGEKLGLQLKGFNYSGYELYNFLNYELGNLQNTYLAVDIGAKNTNIVIISNGVLKFNKIIPKGYIEATKDIIQELNCNFVKAEQLKRQYNTINLSDGIDKNSEEYIVISNTQKCFEHIIRDVSKIMEFYNASNSKNKINEMYVVGTVGKINGLEKYFSDKVKIPTKVIKTLNKVNFQKIAVELKSRQLNFMNCFGANKLSDNEFKFIKGELKIQKISFVLKAGFHKLAVACIAMLLVIVGLGVYSNNQILIKVDEYDKFINSKQEFRVLDNKVKAKRYEVEALEKYLANLGDNALNYLLRLEIVEKTVYELKDKASIYILKYEFNKESLLMECLVPIVENMTNEQYSVLMGIGNEFKSEIEKNFEESNIKISRSELSKIAKDKDGTSISFKLAINF